MQILEKAKLEKEASSEIETEHTGHLLSQDTYYVGNIKGVGRIYQQTVIDTYSKVAFAKLYTDKTAITSADMLNDQVVPFFNKQQIPVLRILTDRGTEVLWFSRTSRLPTIFSIRGYRSFQIKP